MNSAGNRAFVYVDGFNLYHGALENSPHKWVNLKALAETVLPGISVPRLVFCTASVSAPQDDPDKPTRQQVYWRALATVPEIQRVRGHFVSKPKWFPLHELNAYNGSTHFPPCGGMSCVRKFEEKGSDVNLASYMLMDAADRASEFDMVVVISNDSDLEYPIAQLSKRYSKKIALLCPHETPSEILRKLAVCNRIVTPRHLFRSQFPEILRDSAKEFWKPSYWNLTVCRGAQGGTGFLDNRYRCSFQLDGRSWCDVSSYENSIRRQMRDFHAKNAHQDPAITRYVKDSFLIEHEWNAIRGDVLLRALRAKFEDPTLKQNLLATGETHIVYYSTPRTGKPKPLSYMGRALEAVRRELAQTQQPASP